MNHYANKWNIIIDFEEAESYKESSNAQTVEEVIAEASKNNYIKEHLYEITNMWISLLTKLIIMMNQCGLMII